LKISKEIKIGFIFAAGAFILVWGINFFKDRHLFSSNRTLYAVYKDIAGLTPANPIIVNGMKIGQIDDVYFTKDTTGKIVVRMIIDNKLIDIPRNSTARIITSDIMGARKMEIVLGNDYQHLAQQGDTLPSSVQTSILDVVSEQFAPVKEKAERTIASLDSVLVVIKDIFNKKTQSDLQEAMSSLNNMIHSIEHATKQVDVWVAKDGKLNTIFGNIESISTNIRNNNDKITKVIKNFSDISDSLAKANFAATINNANQILSNANDIIAKINKGEGTMGLLMNNDSLYNGLSRSAADLDKLLKDLKENPKRYINFSLF